MWFFIWLLVTVFIISVSAWSFLILRQQKKSWKTFSDKHKFTYTGGRLMESPHMRGRAEGFIVNFYTDTQQSDDIRGVRYVTVVELEMGEGLPVKSVVGTEKMKNFVNQLVLKKDIRFDHEGWKDGYIARTSNKKKLRAYLTQERLDILMKVFAMKGASALFFCDEVDAVLRLETGDPLRDADKMERIMKRLLRDMKILAPNAAERKQVPKREEDDEDEDDVIIVDDDDDDDDETESGIERDEGTIENENAEDEQATAEPPVLAAPVKKGEESGKKPKTSPSKKKATGKKTESGKPKTKPKTKAKAKPAPLKPESKKE